jgi:CheY-like chemotaxis protein
MDTPKPVPILIVEDEWLIAADIKGLLGELGLTNTKVCTRLASALETIEREAVEFTPLDVALGKDKVFPVAEKLRDRGAKFAFVTAELRENLPQEWRDRPLLAKPVQRGELAAAMRPCT